MAENTDFAHAQCETLKVTAAADINAGEIFLYGDTYLIAYTTLETGDEGAGAYDSQWLEAPKATGAGTAFTVGSFVWLTPGATPLTVHNADAGTDVKVGIVKEPATDAATHVNCVWKGYGI